MAYACPVCTEPQIDAEHLANHVAFTAITGDDAHEEWLDSTVEEWGQLGEAELAAVVVDHAEETAFPVDLDAADVEAGGHDGGAGDGHDHGHQHDVPAATPPAELDDEAQDVLAEARELTREMQGDEEESTGSENDADAADSSAVDSSDSETQ